MAILHRAWTFDAPALTRELAATLQRGGADALRRAARDAVDDASPMMLASLPDVRFDEEWLEPPDEDSDRVLESFAILLVAHLVPAPPAATHPGGQLELARVLQSHGWQQSECDLLLRGRPLESLFEGEAAATFAGAGQYGGWIARADASALHKHITELCTRDPALSLKQARAMLDASAERDADLFVVLD